MQGHLGSRRPTEGDGHGHEHEPVPTHGDVAAGRIRRLRLVVSLNVVIVVGEAVAGIVSGSLGLLADAAHNLTDVGGVALALLAIRWTQRRPTWRRSFGYHRGTVLAAQANAALILATTTLVLVEGVRRVVEPTDVEGGVVIVVATIALVANTGSVLLLRDGRGDINMRAALVHMAADAAASAGVALGGLLIVWTGVDRLDAVVSIAIAVLIGWQALALLRAAGDVLLESTPSGFDLAALTEAMRAVAGVDDVHDVHVWSLSSEVRALSAHVTLSGNPSLEEAQSIGSTVKATVCEPFRIAHATLELESARCVDDGTWCTIADLDVRPAPPHHGHAH